MSESKTKRALLQKLNLQPHPASALPLGSLTIGYSFSRLKRENAELLLLDNSSSSRTFIKPTPLLFKIFEQVVAWLPPSFRGLLTPALTQQNKAETFAQHTISPLPCSPCTKCPLMKGRQRPELQNRLFCSTLELKANTPKSPLMPADLNQSLQTPG